MIADHDRIVIPYTEPDRFDDEEKALFDEGRCSWQIAHGGYGLGPQYCGQPSRAGASFGNCGEHDRDLLETHYPDGSRRP